MSRHSAALSSATQHAMMPPEFYEKWVMETLHKREQSQDTDLILSIYFRMSTDIAPAFLYPVNKTKCDLYKYFIRYE